MNTFTTFGFGPATEVETQAEIQAHTASANIMCIFIISSPSFLVLLFLLLPMAVRNSYRRRPEDQQAAHTAACDSTNASTIRASLGISVYASGASSFQVYGVKAAAFTIQVYDRRCSQVADGATSDREFGLKSEG
jgi:hypothetical protein